MDKTQQPVGIDCNSFQGDYSTKTDILNEVKLYENDIAQVKKQTAEVVLTACLSSPAGLSGIVCLRDTQRCEHMADS